jgi:PAS domain S-box-containing protein
VEEMLSQTITPDTQLFRDVFDASPIGIAVENLEGQPLFVNPAFRAFLGFSEEELHNKHCVDFSPPEDAEKDWNLFQQLRAGSIDHYQLEKRYFRRDGSLVWGSLSVSLLKHTPPLVVAMVEDITDQKNAEEARSRHAAIVESSEDAIASATLDGVIVSWNAGAERLFGYAETEVIGKSVLILVPPELPEEEKKIFETLKAGGRINQLETVRMTKTGKRINVSLSISSVKDTTGKIVGFSGITRDITERKLAQQALRESEERLRLAVEAGKMFAYSWDAATDAIERSGESAQILGTKKEEEATTGAAILAMVHPDDKQRLEAAVAKLSVGNPTLQITYRIIRPDGTVAWLERNSRAHFDAQGKLQRIIGMIKDVTERKQAEELQRETNRALEKQSAELQAREELLKIFVKNVPAAVAMLDRDMRYLQVSDRWCTDYLAGRAQILGHSHYAIFPDMPERWKEVHGRALQGETLRADEDRWDGQDGPHWARWEVRPWKTAEGAVGGILILSEDITRRRQMEETLSGMSRKLIEAQEQERARISRELHDDINQRLALLAGELDLWDQSASGGPDLHHHLEQAKQRIIEISSDVQALSHELHSSKLEYLGLAAAAKSLCREVAEKNNVEIDFKQDGVPRSLSDEVSLSLFRILQESLHNSVEHSGVKHIEVQLWEHSNEIHLVVKDLGRGFDVEVAKQGKGLGLTSMQERVRLVNGTITVQSKPMGGTTIHVSVPVAEEEAQRAFG